MSRQAPADAPTGGAGLGPDGAKELPPPLVVGEFLVPHGADAVHEGPGGGVVRRERERGGLEEREGPRRLRTAGRGEHGTEATAGVAGEVGALGLDAAMRLASIEGLSNLTIGRLARELGISRSGVFAHFRSKERLQRETIEVAGEVFEREVLAPVRMAPQGLAQLEAFCDAYLSYLARGVFPGGCFFAHLLDRGRDAVRATITGAVVERVQR